MILEALQEDLSRSPYNSSSGNRGRKLQGELLTNDMILAREQ